MEDILCATIKNNYLAFVASHTFTVHLNAALVEKTQDA